MKKKTGFSVAGVVAGVAAIAVLIIATVAVINGNNSKVDYSAYDYFSVIEGTEDNGYIGDHVKGYDPETGEVVENSDFKDTAQLLIYEYADFQCSGCASMNPRLNTLIEELQGKLAVVYRNYVLSYHQNGTAAASAAEAAGLQGYWKKYADKLYTEQSEWYYASGSERTALFDQYFTEVTEGHGDLDQFNADLESEAVSKKVSFDIGTGQRVDIAATPALYIDGEYLDLSSGEFTFRGQTFTWDGSSITSTELNELITNIVNAALEE